MLRTVQRVLRKVCAPPARRDPDGETSLRIIEGEPVLPAGLDR